LGYCKDRYINNIKSVAESVATTPYFNLFGTVITRKVNYNSFISYDLDGLRGV
jgi:hypothetical protein